MKRRSRQRGVTLLETIMSACVASVLIVVTVPNMQQALMRRQLEGAALEMYSNLLMARSQALAKNAMGDPLRQLVGVENPFGVDTPSAYAGEASNSCLTYSYDLNGNGALDTGSAATDERLGYRLRQGVVQIRGSGEACGAANGWSAVTTAATVQITSLQFAVTTTLNPGVTERLATVTIAGRLVNDGTVTRALSRTVRLPNDV